MSHRDNADLRNRADGGWFWAEHELFSVFAPLIGADGVAAYMAVCRLIPLAAIDQDKPVTVRAVERASMLSKSQAHRKMSEIVRLGMVIEQRGAKNRPSTYKLVSLRALSLVGIVELKRRLGVPPGDTERDMFALDATKQYPFATLQEATARANTTISASSGSEGETSDLASLSSVGVPPGDTSEINTENRSVEHLVSQKTASVSQKWGVGVPENALGVPESAFVKEEEVEEEVKTPGGSDLRLPFADIRHGERGYAVALGEAARWVMAVCGISRSSMERVLIDALNLRAKTIGDPLHQVARLAARSHIEYAECKAGGVLQITYGAAAFFGDGHWQSPATWPLRPEARAPRGSGVSLFELTAAEIERSSVAYDQRVQEYVLGLATEYDATDDLAIFGHKIRHVLERPAPLTELDKTLQAIEDELCEVLKSSASAEEIAECRVSLAKKFAMNRSSMPAAKIQQEITNRIGVELMSTRRLPRLSLFFMRAP